MHVQQKPTLITKKGLSQRWGISKQAVHNRSIRHKDFPKPFEGTDDVHPLYLISDIEKYEKARGYTPILEGGQEE
ncbi:hypothetical protein [Aneurinibacillus thermoaerophilus]|uniref:hypothetical protein n=1 Tax=Aneurinibacillus thermoaerophilus TaxID=143495 RepID=UPI002E1C7771|nr:hypothetical protein [Aneurinibacillus thermoaerophilus]